VNRKRQGVPANLPIEDVSFGFMDKIFYSAGLLITLFLFYSFQVSVTRPKSELLAGKTKSKFWDAKYGYNWHFGESSFREFDYNKPHDRSWATVYDVILPPYTWDISRDTLFIRFKKKVYQKYLIYKLTEDTLVVYDFDNSWGRDTLFFRKSPDQIHFPK
jgi:hypothetical protein